MDVSQQRCVLCGGTAFDVKYRFNHFYIPSMARWLDLSASETVPEQYLLECRSCHLLSLYPLPPRELIEKLHNDPHYGFDRGDEVGSMVFAHDAMETVYKVRRQQGRLLDIGCSKGMFMAVARQDGWDATGVDFNPEAIAFAKDVWNLNVHLGNAEDMGFGDQQFDLITMWDVIEHLPDPLKFLKKIKALLKPGGLLAFETPNAGSLYAKLRRRYWGWGPHHLYYFTPATITALLTEAGFAVKLLETPNFNVLSREGWYRLGLSRDLWMNSIGQKLRHFLFTHRNAGWVQHLLHMRQRRRRLPAHSFHLHVNPEQKRKMLEPWLRAGIPAANATALLNEPFNVMAEYLHWGDQLRVVAERRG